MESHKYYHFTVYFQEYKILIPTRKSITDVDRKAFDTFNAKLRTYHGEPQQLIEACDLVQTIESAPLFFAAMAAVKRTQAYLFGHESDASVLAEAKDLLNQALAIAPSEPSILKVAIDIYLADSDYPKAEEILDGVMVKYPYDIDFKVAKIHYLGLVGTARQVTKALKAFDRDPATDQEQHRLNSATAHAYLLHNDWKQSIKYYKKVTKFDPHNPWAWYNMSIAQHALHDLVGAFRSCRKALKLMEFGAARQMHTSLRNNLIAIAIVVVLIFSITAIIEGVI